ncbi:MAG: tetratricopeptide repeat protein, partial [bacterium]|nr:tetratricopeptide repeat protein [bacterium]
IEKRSLSEADSTANMANLKLTQLLYSDAARYYRKAIELVPKGCNKELRDYLNGEGYAYFLAGKYEKALPLFKEALENHKKLLPANYQYIVKIFNYIAMTHHKLGQYKDAHDYYTKCLDINKDKKPLEYADSLKNMAILYLDTGDYEKAEPLFKKSRQIFGKNSDKNRPEYADVLKGLARLYHRMGQYKKSEILFQECLSVVKKT